MSAQTLLIFAPRCRAAALAALVAFGAAACGRIGPLEPPPDANAPAKPAATSPEESAGAAIGKPKIPPIMPPKQPFILDPLLK